MTLQRNRSAALPGAPRPARITFLGIQRARFAGRRDGKDLLPPPAGGFAFIRQLLGCVHHAEARTGQALHEALTSLDERIAGEGALHATLVREAAVDLQLPPEPYDGAGTSPEALHARREDMRRRAAAAARTRAIAGQERRLRELLVARTRLHDEARSLVDTYVARYEALCSAHRRAWRARLVKSGTEPDETTELAPYRPGQGWMQDDVPAPYSLTEVSNHA